MPLINKYNKVFIRLVKILVLLVVIVLNVNKLYAEELIPRKVLFGNPEKVLLRLSEDEKYLSYLANKNGVLNIWVAPTEDSKNAVCITNAKDRNIRHYDWAFDSRYVFYLQDFKGNENFVLHVCDIKTKEVRKVSFGKGVKTDIVERNHINKTKIIIGINDRRKDFFDLYEIDLKTLRKKLLYKNDTFIRFHFDNNMNIRMAYQFNDEGGIDIYLNKNKKKWEKFMTIDFEDVRNARIVGFDKSGKNVYLIDNSLSDTSSLVCMNIKTKEKKVIYNNPKCDIDSVGFDYKTRKPDYLVTEYLEPNIKVLNKGIKDDIAFLQKHLGSFFHIVDRTDKNTKWIIGDASTTRPPRYYLYDRKNKTIKFLFSIDSKLEKYKFDGVKSVIIKTRDGLDMVGYLVLPESFAKNKKPIPMILEVHGGPNARRHLGFDPLKLFFANRGYAYLSVNFRGSTGYGKKFINLGNKKWGKEMQNDLTDAVKWAIKEKIADPKKVAIMGVSYGGYATLAGLTFTPDLYACGIDIVGPSNIITLLKSIPKHWKPGLINHKMRVGEYETEEGIKDLKERSPFFHAHKIKKPLFIIQGKHDVRVKKNQSEHIVAELRKHKIPVTYALFHNEGHGIRHPKDRIALYAMIEQFLSNILGGRAEPIGDAFEGAYFEVNGGEPVKDKEFYR